MPRLIVEISGPNFQQSANSTAGKLKARSVDELRVNLGNFAPEAPQVKSAVGSLHSFLKSDAAIIFIGNTPAGAAPATASGPVFGNSIQTFLLDNADASTILTQMAAGNQKGQMDRWKLQQDTQAKIFEVMQDITRNKATTQDKAYKKWDEYIRG